MTLIVMLILGKFEFSRPQGWIYLKCNQNIFPQQIHLGKRAVGWAEGEITDWINQKMETRGVK